MNKKTIALVFIMLLLLLVPFSPAFAADDEPPPLPDLDEVEGEGEVEDTGGMFERTLAAIVDVPIRIIKKVGEKMGLVELDELVFGEHMWSDKEALFINLWYTSLSVLVIPFFVVTICVTAYKLILSGTNPGLRTEAIDSIWRWFGALLIIMLAPLLVDTLLRLVAIFLGGIKSAFQFVASSAGIDRNISDWASVGFADVKIVTGSYLGTAIVKLMFLFIYIYLNVLYIVRMLAVSVMLCFTPVMAFLWAINKNVNAAAVWLGEITSNAFMPVAHSLVLCLILGFCNVKDISDGSWFKILILMYTLIPMSEVLRNSLQGLLTRASGLNEAGAASNVMASAAGLGGLVSLARVGRATFSGQNVNTSNLSGIGGSASHGPVNVNPGSPSAPGGGAPTIYSGPSDSGSGGRQIGFGADHSQSQPQATDNNKAMKWTGYAMRGATVAGTAFGGLAGMVGGAVPGGTQVANLMTKATTGAMRATVMTGSIMGQAANKTKTEGMTLTDAIKDTVGVKQDGIKGAIQTIGRAGNATIQAARDEQAGMNTLSQYQSPPSDSGKKRPIGFNPRRGLV